jgi:hypothetical protein
MDNLLAAISTSCGSFSGGFNGCLCDYPASPILPLIEGGGMLRNGVAKWIGTDWRNQSEWPGGIARNTHIRSWIYLETSQSLVVEAARGLDNAADDQQHYV